MIVSLGWMLVASLHAVSTPIQFAQHVEAPRQSPAVGRIGVWTDRDGPYRRGEGARIYVRSEQPAYITVLRVDTDGRIRTLFPREPWRSTRVRGGRTLEVTDRPDGGAFKVDDYPGIGYVFAIASRSPFDYDDITRGDYWDFRVIDDGRIQGDPYVILTDLAARIAPRGYQYDISPYYVERRYAYPRFVCYDCHSYASYQQWDPYATSCRRFRVVIYDDPSYYPYRYNQGRSVVVDRPEHPAPRYVFKDAEPGIEYVTRLRRAPGDQARRVANDRGRTSADIGGPGIIPAPGVAPVRRRFAEEAPRGAALQGETPARPPKGPPADGRAQSRDGRRGSDDAPEGLRPVDRDTRRVPPVQRGSRTPQSTGEPELRRRKP